MERDDDKVWEAINDLNSHRKLLEQELDVLRVKLEEVYFQVGKYIDEHKGEGQSE